MFSIMEQMTECEGLLLTLIVFAVAALAATIALMFELKKGEELREEIELLRTRKSKRHGKAKH
jgi:hypothetical protein